MRKLIEEEGEQEERRKKKKKKKETRGKKKKRPPPLPVQKKDLSVKIHCWSIQFSCIVALREWHHKKLLLHMLLIFFSVNYAYNNWFSICEGSAVSYSENCGWICCWGITCSSLFDCNDLQRVRRKNGIYMYACIIVQSSFTDIQYHHSCTLMWLHISVMNHLCHSMNGFQRFFGVCTWPLQGNLKSLQRLHVNWCPCVTLYSAAQLMENV